MLQFLRRITVAAAVLAWGRSAASDNSSAVNSTYDYIVVGSGPGGGPLAADLARAGYSVLLLDAGSNLTADANYSDLSLATVADSDVRSRWDFFVKHSDDPARELKYEHMVWREPNGTLYVGLDPPSGSEQLGIWYPRAAVLGGCAMHNAAYMEMPTDDFWDGIVNITGDSSWGVDNMRRIMTDIENCHYEPEGTPGHGFDGWIDSNQYSSSSWLNSSADGVAIMQQIASRTGAGDNLTISGLEALHLRDMDSLDVQKDPLGIFGITVHADASFTRSSPANYVQRTLDDSAGYPLTLQLNTFVTHIDFDTSGETPTATGVEYVVGESVYQADPRYTAPATPLPTQHAIATKEVIIAGGAFNSPQILKVSGIGPAAELEQFNITVVADIPDVGNNLSDNYEGAVVGLSDTEPDNIGGTYTTYLKTSQSEGPRDIFMWAFNGGFEGFWPGFPDDMGPNALTFSFVHMGQRNTAGSVMLKSADPTEPPEINLRYFTTGGEQDLQAMLEAAEFAENVVAGVPASTEINPFQELQPCNGTSPDDCTDAEKTEFIKLQAFSHHATGTCAIGKVVDSDFKVKGVNNLRVVDASVWPLQPGAFPVLPTFLLSRKAVEAILADA